MMYAVVDTNVLISSMITHDDSSPTVGVLTSIFNGDIVPIYNDYLIAEYLDVKKHHARAEIKAVTYHMLSVNREEPSVTVIFDV